MSACYRIPGDNDRIGELVKEVVAAGQDVKRSDEERMDAHRQAQSAAKSFSLTWMYCTAIIVSLVCVGVYFRLPKLIVFAAIFSGCSGAAVAETWRQHRDFLRTSVIATEKYLQACRVRDEVQDRLRLAHVRWAIDQAALDSMLRDMEYRTELYCLDEEGPRR